jgi:hypothetical protein
MSTGDMQPRRDRDDPEPRLSQWGTATHGGRVMQAGKNQYILNLGNAFWVTAPAVVAVTLVLVLYVIVGRAAHASGSPVPGAAAPHARQPPLAVTLAYDKNDVANGAPDCVNWIFRRPLSGIPAPSDGVTDETWAHRYGGVDSGATDFKLAVQGVTTTAVQLLGFRVIDIERGPSIHGTDISSTWGCGPSPEAGFEIALGTKPPVITPVPGTDSGAAKKIPFPFVVSSTDIQQFQVQVLSQANPCDCDIKWRLALDWSYEGKTGTAVIDDNGKPFQTIFPPLVSSAIAWAYFNGVWKRFG